MQALLAISLLLSSVASISNLAHLQDVRAHDKAAPTQVPATQTYVVPGAPWAPSNKGSSQKTENKARLACAE